MLGIQHKISENLHVQKYCYKNPESCIIKTGYSLQYAVYRLNHPVVQITSYLACSIQYRRVKGKTVYLYQHLPAQPSQRISQLRTGVEPYNPPPMSHQACALSLVLVAQMHMSRLPVSHLSGPVADRSLM